MFGGNLPILWREINRMVGGIWRMVKNGAW